jgi:hypothetical protein
MMPFNKIKISIAITAIIALITVECNNFEKLILKTKEDKYSEVVVYAETKLKEIGEITDSQLRGQDDPQLKFKTKVSELEKNLDGKMIIYIKNT